MHSVSTPTSEEVAPNKLMQKNMKEQYEVSLDVRTKELDAIEGIIASSCSIIEERRGQMLRGVGLLGMGKFMRQGANRMYNLYKDFASGPSS